MLMEYAYKAVDANGRICQGLIRVRGEADLRQRMDAKQWTLLRYRAVGAGRLRMAADQVSCKQLIGLSLQLEQLLSAGIPPIQALQDLAGTLSHPALRRLLWQLAEDVDGGATLSEAVARHPRAFGAVYAPLLKVGEEAGRVPETLRQLAEMLDWQDRLRQKVIGLLLYPLLLSAVLALVVAVMLGHLVPELAAFTRAASETVPAHSLALIRISELWIEWWHLLPIGIVPLLAGLILGARLVPRFRHRLDALKLRLWLFGPLLLRVQLARFSSGFAMSYAAGINVLDALKLCGRIVDNRALQAALEACQTQVAEGTSISESFARSGLFPGLVVRMLAVGESTGQLDKALGNVVRFYERDIDEAIRRIEPLVAPMMILLLAGFILWIVLAVLGPIYETVLSMGVMR